MSIFKKHAFICSSGKTCPTQGSVEIMQEMKNMISDLGLKQQIRINKAGCMGQCGDGPIMVVYPEAVWYANVQLADVAIIVHQHLIAGEPIERLYYHPKQEK